MLSSCCSPAPPHSLTPTPPLDHFFLFSFHSKGIWSVGPLKVHPTGLVELWSHVWKGTELQKARLYLHYRTSATVYQMTMIKNKTNMVWHSWSQGVSLALLAALSSTNLPASHDLMRPLQKQLLALASIFIVLSIVILVLYQWSLRVSFYKVLQRWPICFSF